MKEIEIKRLIHSIFIIFGFVVFADCTPKKNSELPGTFRGTYGSDQSVYGELILKENQTGTLTLNFCHDLATPEIRWTISEEIISIRIKETDRKCCPEIANEELRFRWDRENQLTYLGKPIYACSLGEAGNILTRIR